MVEGQKMADLPLLHSRSRQQFLFPAVHAAAFFAPHVHADLLAESLRFPHAAPHFLPRPHPPASLRRPPDRLACGDHVGPPADFFSRPLRPHLLDLDIFPPPSFLLPLRPHLLDLDVFPPHFFDDDDDGLPPALRPKDILAALPQKEDHVGLLADLLFLIFSFCFFYLLSCLLSCPLSCLLFCL